MPFCLDKGSVDTLDLCSLLVHVVNSFLFLGEKSLLLIHFFLKSPKEY